MKFPILFLMLILVMTSSCSKEELVDEQINSTALIVSNSEMELEIFELVNDYRIELGLSSLSYDTRAQAYTTEHNLYMISKEEISHDNFALRSSALSEEFNAVKVSENVGRNFATAQGVFEAWLNSPSHLKNIEGDFDATAISAYADANGMIYFTQVFIK
ncbi:CAP domain-containing protein [Maribacter sp. MAR_2009_72]|uniref:CAP domain-containing protein n=1 Tax=Maribacter sp. MAR_2009_72 TaxID=1250050 RepID=UPI00119A47FD|nr:CAP domain-containing protein [Maribacter sp. MAR_2009_72]TVZ17195.1 Cysteine-rich secretory protein family protein [Maribacter sp. MAR_2009_72]TVZ17196.1 Cysteine-rich secretory protein family protein [Maribacter sp. MAR_2009_72]